MGAREEVEVQVSTEQLSAAELACLLCRESESAAFHFLQLLVAETKCRAEWSGVEVGDGDENMWWVQRSTVQ